MPLTEGQKSARLVQNTQRGRKPPRDKRTGARIREENIPGRKVIRGLDNQFPNKK